MFTIVDTFLCCLKGRETAADEEYFVTANERRLACVKGGV